MSRNGEYKLAKIEEILGVDSLEKSLGYVEYDLQKARDRLRETEAKLKEAEAKIAELESCGEGNYGRYIANSSGSIKVFANEQDSSGRVAGNLPFGSDIKKDILCKLMGSRYG